MTVATQDVVPQTYAFPVLTGTSPGVVFNEEPPAPIAFDRRRLPRKQMSGFAMTVFSFGFAAGTVARVELVDGSHTGLGIKSPVPVEPGAAFSMVPEDRLMPRQVGIAVRCELVDGEYHVGLRMRRSSMAA